MASLNTNSLSSTQRTRTHEGAKARTPKPLEELRRAVLSCFLWENSFYESGNDLANRMSDLISKIKSEDLCSLAIEARHDMNLRHVPLFLAIEMLKCQPLTVRKLIPQIVNRPDDLTELLSIYWKKGKRPIPNQLKRGIADALPKFSEYQLAKYQNVGGIKVRDLFNLVHPKPQDKKQEKTWKTLMTKGLPAPDTWEVKISAQGNNKDAWESLLAENKLGAMALLRNLRNMLSAGVDKSLIEVALLSVSYDRVLPFRFIAAAKHAPQLEPEIEAVFFDKLKGYPRLEGKTAILVDVSGSMLDPISGKSDMQMIDAACGLAMIMKEISDTQVFAFHTSIYEMPPRKGFALRDAIRNVGTGGTCLGGAIRTVEHHNPNLDRLIVFTDEQSHDQVSQPKTPRSYMINVASYKPQVSYGDWISITGFSERIVDFISMIESV